MERSHRRRWVDAASERATWSAVRWDATAILRRSCVLGARGGEAGAGERTAGECRRRLGGGHDADTAGGGGREARADGAGQGGTADIEATDGAMFSTPRRAPPPATFGRLSAWPPATLLETLPCSTVFLSFLDGAFASSSVLHPA